MKKVKELSLDRLVELIEDNIPDPRRPGGNIRHKLVDLFVIILLGIICGCETWIDIEDYAEAKEEWLKTFLERYISETHGTDKTGDLGESVPAMGIAICRWLYWETYSG